MVCFWYIIVHSLHKGDKNDNNNYSPIFTIWITLHVAQIVNTLHKGDNKDKDDDDGDGGGDDDDDDGDSLIMTYDHWNAH